MDRKRGRPGFYISTGVALAMLCVGCREARNGAPSKAALDVKFAPVIMDVYASWSRPKAGDTFRLKLTRPKAEVHLPPERLWVYRVVRKIPDFESPQSWRPWLKKARAPTTAEEKPDSHTWYFHRKVPGTNAYRGVTVNTQLRMMYFADANVPPIPDLFKAAQKNSVKKMRAMGEERVKAMGWWPEGVNPKPIGQGVDSAIGGGAKREYIQATVVTYGGLLEGVPVEGDGLKMQIKTMSTGMLRCVDLGWAESRRYKNLPTKSIEEAFEALNRGFSMGISKARIGALAQYQGWTYYCGSHRGPYIQPMYKFRLKDNMQDRGWLCYVPAIKSEHFADPKCQVLCVEEWKAVRGKKSEQKP